MVALYALFAVLFQVNPDWNGEYTGTFEGQTARATLQEQNDHITGDLVIADYPYKITATVNGNNSAQGQLTDQSTGGQLPLTLYLESNKIQFQLQNMQFTLTKSGAVQAGGPLGAVNATSSTPTSENVERDQRLIGSWIYTETYMSGDFSSVSQTKMIINADGSYQYGDGKSAGGGAYGSFDTGGGGGWSTGEWKTGNAIIYIREQGNPNWTPYCQYIVDYGSLLFKFADGSKMLWKRN